MVALAQSIPAPSVWAINGSRHRKSKATLLYTERDRHA